MYGSLRIRITVPEALLDAIDRERAVRHESRGEFIRSAVEQQVGVYSHASLGRVKVSQGEADRLAVERYLDGYRKLPESPEKIQAARRAGEAILAEQPWE